MAYDELTRVKAEAESNLNQYNKLKLQHAKAIYFSTKIESKRNSWRDKTAALKIEKDITKLWKLTKQQNEEESHGQKITVMEVGDILRVGNLLLTVLHAKSDVKESDITTQMKEAGRRQNETASRVTPHHPMTNSITLPEFENGIKIRNLHDHMVLLVKCCNTQTTLPDPNCWKFSS